MMPAEEIAAVPPAGAKTASRRSLRRRLRSSVRQRFRRIEPPIHWLTRGLFTATLLFAIPALLAGLTIRYVVPKPWDPVTEAAFPRLIARLGEEHLAPLAVGSFLLFALMARYWSSLLPDGWFLGRRSAEERLSLRNILSLVAPLGLALLLALLLRASIVEPYRVLSSSMLPTLEPGDQLVANKLAYGFRPPGLARGAGNLPRRSDLVVFRNPVEGDQPAELVKRVVGVPGDRIRMEGSRLHINDWPVPTCYAGGYVHLSPDGAVIGRAVVEFLEDRAYLTLHAGAPGARFGPYEVASGEVFVLGDFRSQSADSRAWNKGRGKGLRVERVLGRADWLIGTARTAGAQSSLPFHAIGTELQAEGVDASMLRAGVERCLETRPAHTSPPAPVDASLVSK